MNGIEEIKKMNEAGDYQPDPEYLRAKQENKKLFYERWGY